MRFFAITVIRMNAGIGEPSTRSPCTRLDSHQEFIGILLKVIFLQTFFFPWWAEEIITLCLNVEMTVNIAKVRKFEENFRLNIENRATFTIHGSHGSFAPIYVHCRAKRATKYIDLRLNAHIRYSLFFHPLPSQTSHLIYMLPQKWPCIYMLFASREVRIGKNCARSLEVHETEGTVFPNTDRLGWWITLLFFSKTQRNTCQRTRRI